MPSSLNELIIFALARELNYRGFTCLAEGNRLPIHTFSLEVQAVDAQLKPLGNGYFLSTTFRTTSSHFLPEGIEILSVGRGNDQASAIDNAVQQWIVGVLPTFTSYLGNHKKNALDATMVVGAEETSEKYGWTVHQGPVISRSHGRETSESQRDDDSEIFHAIFQVVHPYAAHGSLFWLECFALRHPDRKLDPTCRFNNVDWEEGRAALLTMASEWATIEDTVISKRQFLLFEPTPIENLSDLAEKVDEHMNDMKSRTLPWWKRIFKKTKGKRI